jgi:hypothetical protein
MHKAIELIERQQAGIENTAPWMVGEQLKDICRREPASAGLIAHDLTVPEMSLTAAEKKIKIWADTQKKRGGGCVCVPPNVAEGILREFYGLAQGNGDKTGIPSAAGMGLNLNLEDFL